MKKPLLAVRRVRRIHAVIDNHIVRIKEDELTDSLCTLLAIARSRIRTDISDGDLDWEEGFYILRKSWCPAVLTENFFMDNHSDLEYLQSRAGKQAVVDTHVEGIVEWLESLKS